LFTGVAAVGYAGLSWSRDACPRQLPMDS